MKTVANCSYFVMIVLRKRLHKISDGMQKERMTMNKTWWKEAVAYQIYQSRFGLSLDERDSINHGCKDGAEPNNWESIFNGSAWEYDEETEQ